MYDSENFEYLRKKKMGKISEEFNFIEGYIYILLMIYSIGNKFNFFRKEEKEIDFVFKIKKKI